MGSDYYMILGVAETATAAQIQDAYRRLAKLYHPDVSGGDTVRAFREVQEAWHTLGDAERRQAYDAGRRVRQVPHPRRRSGARAGWQPRPQPRSRPAGEPDLHLELHMTAAEAGVGGRTSVELPAAARCPTCLGGGRLLAFTCPDCLGRGWWLEPRCFDLDVPAGLRNGAVMQLSLEGLGLLHQRLFLHVRIEG